MVRLLVIAIPLLILGLIVVGFSLFVPGGECTINDQPAPPEECSRIFTFLGYGLLAVGGILVVVGFLRGRRRYGPNPWKKDN